MICALEKKWIFFIVQFHRQTNKTQIVSRQSVLTLSPLTRARVDKVRVEIAGLLNIVEHFTYPFDFLPVNCNNRTVKRINKIIMALQYSGVSYVTRVIMTNISTPHLLKSIKPMLPLAHTGT